MLLLLYPKKPGQITTIPKPELRVFWGGFPDLTAITKAGWDNHQGWMVESTMAHLSPLKWVCDTANPKKTYP